MELRGTDEMMVFSMCVFIAELDVGIFRNLIQEEYC